MKNYPVYYYHPHIAREIFRSFQKVGTTEHDFIIILPKKRSTILQNNTHFEFKY